MTRLLAIVATTALLGCPDEPAVEWVFPRLQLAGADDVETVQLYVVERSGGALAPLAGSAKPLEQPCVPSCDGRTVDISVPSGLGELWVVVLGSVGDTVTRRHAGPLPKESGEHVIALAPIGCVDSDGDGFCAAESPPLTDCDDTNADFGPLLGCPSAPAPDDVIQTDDGAQAPDALVPLEAVDDDAATSDAPSGDAETTSPPAHLCEPCASEGDCDPGALCVAIGGVLGFCGAPCQSSDDCPPGYSCGELEAGGHQCLPDAGGCPCTGPTPAFACQRHNQSGDCDGEWTCGADDLWGCDAAPAQAESCDGEDNDCDGALDEDYPSVGKACTAGEGGCQQSGAWACLPSGDGVVCSTEGKPLGASCDDQDVSTHPDQCTGGPQSKCVGEPFACSGACRSPAPDGECVLAAATCYIGTGGCEPTDPTCVGSCYDAGANPTGEPDDQAQKDLSCLYCNPATPTVWSKRSSGYECSPASCAATLLTPASACDGAGACVPAAKLDCDDGDVCTGLETCLGGACIAGTAVDCDDNVGCTLDACDPISECSNTPDDAACTDDDVCTGIETCTAAGCEAGTILTCDDGHPCTTDGCEPDAGCKHAPVHAACDDKDSCTLDTCVPDDDCIHTEIVCSDDLACTADTCVSGTGCVFSSTCDDGLPCTDDTCEEEECSFAITCDDGVDCTTDSCEASGCAATPHDEICADDEPCNGAETCHPELGCQSGVAVDCDDGVACTTDSCVPGSTDCAHTPLDAACEDGLACTADSCDAEAGCANPLMTGRCLIGGQCVDAEASDPQEPCRVCVPKESEEGWTELPDGTPCGAEASGICVFGTCRTPQPTIGIPAATSYMGCSAALDTECDDPTLTWHTVALAAYEIDVAEVTAAEYRACVLATGGTEACTGGAGPCCTTSGTKPTYTNPEHADRPMTGATWFEAGAYCAWAQKRLCTEAEWERAARGGCDKHGPPCEDAAALWRYPGGSAPPPSCTGGAVYGYCTGDGLPAPVVGPDAIATVPSPYGVLSMAGNTQEWVADGYAQDYYASSPNTPYGPCEATERVLRGGGFHSNPPSALRVYLRSSKAPDASSVSTGIRCCRDDTQAAVPACDGEVP